MTRTFDSILAHACARAGLSTRHAVRVQVAENAIYRLRPGVIARVGRTGQAAVAIKEVRVARWLEHAGLPAARVLPDVDQPVDVDGAAVTFWRELPTHQPGDSVRVAEMLRRLHRLEPPTWFHLPSLAPFVRIRERVQAALIPAVDRDWLLSYLDDLERRYAAGLPPGLAPTVVHGDAWVGNVVIDDTGTAWLVDLERFAVGPPEWDLVSTAVRFSSFGSLGAAEYSEFCRTYGHDVMSWDGYETLRDIRELRACSYMLQQATTNPAARAEAAMRVACLRGAAGPRPWSWSQIS